MGTLAHAVLGAVLILAVARLLGRALERINQPAVVGEVLTGVVLGTAVLGDASTTLFPADVRSVLTAAGQVALVAYVVRVVLTQRGRGTVAERPAVVRVAIASFVVPAAAGAMIAPAVGDGLAFAVFLGTAFGVTAFPVLVRIVAQQGLADERTGRISLRASGAQETLVWPLLALAVVLAGHGTLRPVLASVAILGGFAFGSLAPSRVRRAVLHRLDAPAAGRAVAAGLPLAFAVPVLAVGFDDFDLGVALLVLVVATVAKFGSASLAAGAAGLPRAEALTIGALMNCRGLVEVVVLGVGRDAGLLDDRVYAAMLLMALLSTVAAGPLVAACLSRRPGRGGVCVPSS